MKKRPDNKQIKQALVIFLASFIWITAVRFVLYNPTTTHYHANFAIYINGEREMFDSFVFYEEVTQCGGDAEDPKRRTHMHDDIPDVVHVHDEEVTWGHFFANLGFTLGNRAISTRSETLVEGPDNDFSFILNGEEISQIANRIIGDEDRLLIDLGSSDKAVTQSRYDKVAKTAAAYNETADPSACSGSEVDTSFTERLKKALIF